MTFTSPLAAAIVMLTGVAAWAASLETEPVSVPTCQVSTEAWLSEAELDKRVPELAPKVSSTPRPGDPCRGLKGTACFTCRYNQFLNDDPAYNGGQCPQEACENANISCGTRKTCTPCGRTVPPPLYNGCNPLEIKNTAEQLHGSACGGGPRGADKVAHCWAHCMAATCSIAGSLLAELLGYLDDDALDHDANRLGMACGISINQQHSCPLQPPIPGGNDAEKCLQCCGAATHGMSCN